MRCCLAHSPDVLYGAEHQQSQIFSFFSAPSGSGISAGPSSPPPYVHVLSFSPEDSFDLHFVFSVLSIRLLSPYHTVTRSTSPLSPAPPPPQACGVPAVGGEAVPAVRLLQPIAAHLSRASCRLAALMAAVNNLDQSHLGAIKLICIVNLVKLLYWKPFLMQPSAFIFQ